MTKTVFDRILIFGASGMVGKNLVDTYPLDAKLFLPNRNELDLLNKLAVDNYIAQVKPDLIINCAGKVGGITANMSSPYLFFTENLIINQNIILGAKKNSIKYLLNLGSSCMYPRDAENPLKEEYLLKGELEPTNEGYALAKIVAQRMIQYLSNESTFFCYKTVIPCNLYGKYDKFDQLNSHMIPAVIARIHETVKKNENVITIWGDGKARREFMYTEDLANMIWEIIPKIEQIPNTMNLGLGYDQSIQEYYEVISEIVGFKGTFQYDLTKPIGMKRKVVSIELQDKFGFKATHSLKDGIEKTFNYYLENILK
ncbi:MAG: NAD-dependent epimerase/dehydratase family protein [Flavobacteriales bacterium]|nr:NAD-dependent epimerase/dehydratase family protein [Flavobacteriales bacterium]